MDHGKVNPFFVIATLLFISILPTCSFAIQHKNFTSEYPLGRYKFQSKLNTTPVSTKDVRQTNLLTIFTSRKSES